VGEDGYAGVGDLAAVIPLSTELPFEVEGVFGDFVGEAMGELGEASQVADGHGVANLAGSGSSWVYRRAGGCL